MDETNGKHVFLVWWCEWVNGTCFFDSVWGDETSATKRVDAILSTNKCGLMPGDVYIDTVRVGSDI